MIERELERERDPVATIYLRLRRNVVLEELAREQDEAATDSLADAIETLRSADPDNPWLPPALVMCAYYLSDDDAATAIELCERAAATAREQRRPAGRAGRARRALVEPGQPGTVR